MPEVLRLSTGYEVEFHFESARWKADLRHLANAIIGERIQQLREGGPDRPAADSIMDHLPDDMLEEVRFIVGTSTPLFEHALIAAVIWDAADRAWRSAVRALDSEESANKPRRKGRR
jgi:hypothetical protein